MKNNGWDISDFKKSARLGFKRSRNRAYVFGQLKRYDRRGARRLLGKDNQIED